MSIDEIPVRNDLDRYSLTVSLGSVEFRLTFAWNTRDERWYLDLAKADGTVLLVGLPIVVDMPLVLRFTGDDLPKGYLLATDSTGVGREPAKDDFGDRVKLIFIPAADLT